MKRREWSNVLQFSEPIFGDNVEFQDKDVHF